MGKTTQAARHDWAIPILGITLALTLAIGIGFLIGQQTPSAPDDMSAICRYLPPENLTADCIALRSTIATEGATSTARWALLLSFGSLLASAAALVGLIIAFVQGQRTIAAATDANRIAMDNGQMQARAYVVVEGVESNLIPAGALTTIATFQNSGLSPARGLRWLYCAHVAVTREDNTEQSMFLGKEPDLAKSHWRRDIPSAGSWVSYPLGLSAESNRELAKLIDGAVFVAVTVKIVADYQDVFGNTHKEVACFQGRIKPSADDDTFAELHRAHDGAFDDLAARAAPPRAEITSS